MRLVRPFAIAVALACLMPALPGAQMDPDRVVPNGGISVAGWQGKIDAASVTQGRTINDSKFAQEGNALHLTIGPAAVYWNPANTASGDYTVKGTFKEPKYKDANSHPHPYGIFIGGTQDGHRSDDARVLRAVWRRTRARPRLQSDRAHVASSRSCRRRQTRRLRKPPPTTA